MATSVQAVDSVERIYREKEKVIYIVQFNNPGYHKPGDKISATVLSVIGNGRSYRLELDVCWGARHPHIAGQKIVVGNVGSRFIEPLE